MVNHAEALRKFGNRIANLETSQSSLKKKNKQLLDLVKEILEENKALRKETNFLRSQVNCSNYHCDAVEQYNRKENADFHKCAESENEQEKDVIDAVIDRCNYVLSKSEKFKDTRVDASDIQRCHRVGRKKELTDPNNPPAPRKIICRFKSYKLRQKIIVSKKHLKSNRNFAGSFITENLTPFRSKLLWYVKNHCNGRFVNCHTRDGNITAQLSDAQGENDPWVYIKSPDDLFQYNINVNFKLLKEKYLRFQVHPMIDIVHIHNRFEKLLNEFQDVDT